MASFMSTTQAKRIELPMFGICVLLLKLPYYFVATFSDESRREASCLIACVSCAHNQSPIAIRAFTPGEAGRIDSNSLFLRELFRTPSSTPRRWQQQDFTLSNSRAPNWPMKLTPLNRTPSVSLPQHPAVAYLFLVRPHDKRLLLEKGS
jgi:hypothetical protein